MLGLQPLEEQRVADGAVLDHLGQAGAQLARGQGAQRGGIGDHRARRMERADQILAFGDVHRGLATHRGIHHRQQRGGQLHAVHPAHPAGGGKPGQVAGHAPAERHHAGIAGGAERGQRADRRAETGQRLGGFPGRQHQLTDQQVRPLGQQGGLDPGQVQRGHRVVAEQQHVATAHVLGQQRALAEQARADVDAVRGGAGNGDDAGGGHAVGSCRCHCAARRSTSCAVASAGV
ncbi:hypothetical protein D3C71_1121910 [compost metagenome]